MVLTTALSALLLTMEQFTLKNGVFRNDKGKKLGTLPEVITHYQVARPHYEWSADCLKIHKDALPTELKQCLGPTGC